MNYAMIIGNFGWECACSDSIQDEEYLFEGVKLTAKEEAEMK